MVVIFKTAAHAPQARFANQVTARKEGPWGREIAIKPESTDNSASTNKSLSKAAFHCVTNRHQNGISAVVSRDIRILQTHTHSVS